MTLEEIAGRLGDALARSTADETELCWLETAGDGAATRSLAEPEPSAARTILVRVREGRRRGAFRTGSGEPAEIAAGIRQAIAVSRAVGAGEPLGSGSPAAAEPAPEADRQPRGAVDSPAALWDEEIAALEPGQARALLADATGAGERASLEWRRTRVVVVTSHGVDRRAEATTVTAQVIAGEGARAAAPRAEEPGAGRAAASARSLAALELPAVVLRARRRSADRLAEDPPPPGPLLFSQEAACALVSLLAGTALSARAFETEGAPLAGLLGEHVFSAALDLVDDGLDPAGLPFPFDLLGRSKRRVALVEGGVPRTPAVDEPLADRLRLPPTPHAVGPEEARPEHLFLLPRVPEDEVLAAAEGGVWIGGLEGLVCLDPSRLAARARAVGVRRIRDGRLAEGLSDLVWQDSLLRLFSRLLAVGGEPVRLAEPGFLGGVSAPLIAVDGAEELRPIP
jgi:predicted Zn-dependent protease